MNHYFNSLFISSLLCHRLFKKISVLKRNNEKFEIRNGKMTFVSKSKLNVSRDFVIRKFKKQLCSISGFSNVLEEFPIFQPLLKHLFKAETFFEFHISLSLSFVSSVCLKKHHNFIIQSIQIARHSRL